MGSIERIKWWQWVLISVALGALLGYLNSGGADTAVDHSSASTVVFETNLLLKPWVDPKDSGHRVSYVSNVAVHPVQDVQEGERTSKYQVVSFTHFIGPDQSHPSGWSQEEYLLAPYPYEPTPRQTPNSRSTAYPAISMYRAVKADTVQSLGKKFYPSDAAAGERAIIAANPKLREAAGPKDLAIIAGRYYWIPWDPKDHHTVSDFLLAANQFLTTRDGSQAMPISFHYHWWESSKYGFEIWMGGTLLIIGVIWPTLLTVMVKGGLGKTTPEEYDLNRFKGEPEAEEMKPEPVVDTSASDMQRLRELEESMTAALKSGAAPAAAGVTAVAAAPEIKKLAGGPAHEAEAPKPAEESKEYGGEFYPVAHTVKKADEKS